MLAAAARLEVNALFSTREFIDHRAVFSRFGTSMSLRDVCIFLLFFFLVAASFFDLWFLWCILSFLAFVVADKGGWVVFFFFCLSCSAVSIRKTYLLFLASEVSLKFVLMAANINPLSSP